MPSSFRISVSRPESDSWFAMALRDKTCQRQETGAALRSSTSRGHALVVNGVRADIDVEVDDARALLAVVDPYNKHNIAYMRQRPRPTPTTKAQTHQPQGYS